MDVTCRELDGFDKAIFFHRDMCFIAVRGFLLTIRAGLDVISCFVILRALAIHTFVRPVLFGLNDAGIDDTDFSCLDVGLLAAELIVNLFEQRFP